MFFERLRALAIVRHGALCVGLDPMPDQIPSHLGSGVDAAVRFCSDIVDATLEIACCYKPNAAYFEAYGPGGWEALAAVIAHIPAEVPVVIDAKRGDIGSTAERYAHSLVDLLGASAVTVNPYMGIDSVEPFLRRAACGVYVLGRTSNPSSSEFQDLVIEGRPLHLLVAETAARWSVDGRVGLVVGATFPEQIAAVRKAVPKMPFLIPGVGAQGGDLEASVLAGHNGDAASCLIAVSRTVSYADPGRGFKRAAARSARQLLDRIRKAAPV